MTSALALPQSSLLTSSMVSEIMSDTDPLPGRLDRWLTAHGANLVAVRRHLHAHPELSHQEFETAALVARELAAVGLQPKFLPRGNGVMCDIGSGDRVIALRADLDALPLPDTKDVAYRSTVANAAHACGHDVHTTVLLGVGLALAQLEQQGGIGGRVRLIFQPAEESINSGAPEMISAGALKDVAAIYALHCAPQLPVGIVGVRSGAITAACDAVEVRLSGKGGHTARPHLTADLVYALGRVVTEVPALLGRRVDPRAGLSMVFGSIHAGEASNAIPNEGSARGTIRVLNRDAWREAPDLVTQLIKDVVAGTGAKADVHYTRGVPPVINDRMASAVIAGAAGAALGAERVVEAEISMGGEDFAFYLEHVPGAMIRLGTGIPGAAPMDIHQSAFDVDERAIGYGVRTMVHTALAALASPSF
ncbi:amidohydrolase [Catellatospora vulcania]|uniref:amidohydrolase n=1 Tax=Catellatospora vulcania TaxID=1460450 RepID=UPI001E5B69D7|nr:amidohydrolase [Catellatospora vulcania]